MKRRLYVALAVAVSASLSTECCRSLASSSVSALGEQDFAEGEIVPSDGDWLQAQANENLPTTAIYASPTVIGYYHHGLNPGLPGILTFSLWDLDSGGPGNQVIDFRLDFIPQPIDGFETGEPDGSIKIFQFPVDAALLSDGEVEVYIELGSPANNWVGLDFSRLELVVPEPRSGALTVLGLPLLIAAIRRRK